MSHKLTTVKIENFKSIKTIEFELSEYTPLVGYNNAGKSNILEAIKWVLRKSSLKITDFNDPNNSVIMTAKIEGISQAILDNLNDNHRQRIEPFLNSESLTIRRTQLVPNATAAQIRLEVLNTTDGQWQNNPTGIDNAIKDLFPEPIHIGAMENSEEDVSKSKSSTTIGKLLSEIIGPIEQQYGAKLKTVLDGLKDVLDADGSNRATELSDFDTEVNQKLDSFFPDINIKVHVPTPELKEVFSKGTIKVYENQSLNGTDVSALGHGAQRSIQMTLIRHLADLKTASQQQTTTTLLLIDEPELYLHPQAIEILRKSLKTLANQGYQIIFTTHSPFIITEKDIANTILVRKNTTLGTHKRNSLKSAIPQVEQNAQHQLTLMFALSNSSNILFSERVILTEGKTENRLMPFLIEKISGNSLGVNKCALVQQGGSGNTKKSKLVLDMMDLPCKAIVDLDYAFKQAIDDGFLEANDTDILACQTEMANLATTNGINLNNGWPTKRNSSMTAEEAFALLAQSPSIQVNIQNLKAKLTSNGIWIWTKGAIEKHLNIQGKNEQVWAALKNNIETNGIVLALPNDHQEISDCINWLLN
ncbi:AAA family ATPase [Polaribacter sp. R2A056_3_33]|jgi:predicted ATP-dependent endonuclease of OLD family|uniref:ATP-dependent nuclease n=1 Tax=Polaribacter sp. R2A056_3_33 TaxID=2745563 RepID=UPI001C5015C5|nr:AAA family ATPase [Polaribacter sp. R2A056_3_33]QXP69678.1 AAA family ATPase [Polaribacter sp. R2A056_3_33]